MSEGARIAARLEEWLSRRGGPEAGAEAEADADADAEADVAEVCELAIGIQEELEPLHADALYEVARSLCLLGRVNEAHPWLRRAVRAGFWDAARMREDPAFLSVRKNPAFVDFVRTAWANGYTAMLEREERDSFQRPEEVLRALDLRRGERVADIGAGSGYFTVRLARAVGPGGEVLALDASSEMLDYLRSRVRWEGLDNVRIGQVGREDPELPPRSVDTILLADVLHYASDMDGYAIRLSKGLRPGGRIAVIDYRPRPWSERPWGPPPEQQVPRERVDEAFEGAGLRLTQNHEFLPEQYFVVYRLEVGPSD